ncbi:MAG: hypothetical protein M1825_003992 [Sarcosagium campestre]|nr:MAG: hypothetical protein M1825_003992 [Sarcosagium campestre]
MRSIINDQVQAVTPVSERNTFRQYPPFESLRPCPQTAVIQAQYALECRINSCLCRADLRGEASTAISTYGVSSCSEPIGSVDLADAYSVYDGYCSAYRKLAGQPVSGADASITAVTGSKATDAAAVEVGGGADRTVTATVTATGGAGWAILAGINLVGAVAAPIVAIIVGGWAL